jgi:aquaporin Z
MVMIFAGGHVSGALYNPAVTWGLFLSRRKMISVWKMLGYWVVQLLGGFFGALVSYGLTGKTFSPAPGSAFSISQAFFAELIFTFALSNVQLNVATVKSKDQNHYYGFSIGFTVVGAIYACGNISGGVFNPGKKKEKKKKWNFTKKILFKTKAVGTGGILCSAIFSGTSLKYLWLYWLPQLLAGTFSAMIFRITNYEDYVIRETDDFLYQSLSADVQKTPED